MQQKPEKQEKIDLENQQDNTGKGKQKADKVAEIGGYDGPEPTRFGDWEKNGRCIDF